jgi:hypothetical protein
VTNNAQLKSVEEIRAYLQNALGEATRDTRYTLGFYEALEEIERLTDPAGYHFWLGDTHHNSLHEALADLQRSGR